MLLIRSETHSKILIYELHFQCQTDVDVNLKTNLVP
jgi:hypothetical protein